MAAKLPRHRRAAIRHQFGDGHIDQNLVDLTAILIYQYARQCDSDDPLSRQAARKMLHKIAEFCVAGQFYLADQRPKASKPRGTIETDSGRTSSTVIIKSLAKKTDVLGDYLSPKELRSEYVAALDGLGLSPIEDKLGVTFDGGRTTWDSFRAILSRERNKKN